MSFRVARLCWIASFTKPLHPTCSFVSFLDRSHHYRSDCTVPIHISFFGLSSFPLPFYPHLAQSRDVILLIKSSTGIICGSFLISLFLLCSSRLIPMHSHFTGVYFLSYVSCNGPVLISGLVVLLSYYTSLFVGIFFSPRTPDSSRHLFNAFLTSLPQPPS